MYDIDGNTFRAYCEECGDHSPVKLLKARSKLFKQYVVSVCCEADCYFDEGHQEWVTRDDVFSQSDFLAQDIRESYYLEQYRESKQVS